MRLASKVAVVTGAARGIGRTCALQFAREGASLVLLDVAADIKGVPYSLGTRSQLDHTTRLCREAGSTVLPIQADIRDISSVMQSAATALERFGRVDVLVNCAGIAAPSGKRVDRLDEDEWNLMIDIDLTGSWRMIRAYAEGMLDRRSGSIINIASTAGLVGYRHFAAYVAAKHGVVGLTKAAALDFGPEKVRVNAVCPGSVRDEPMAEGQMLAAIARSLSVNMDEYEGLFAKSQPMNLLMEPDDVAAAATWLASDESRHVTGSVVTIDAGYTAR
jgi:NAD(P)-dependent dehydrogenase (short-subunit alcohol dehydrogenase family)